MDKDAGVNGYWLGSYELGGQKVFLENLKRGDVVFDIGSHVGFYSILSAELVGKERQGFFF